MGFWRRLFNRPERSSLAEEEPQPKGQGIFSTHRDTWTGRSWEEPFKFPKLPSITLKAGEAVGTLDNGEVATMDAQDIADNIKQPVYGAFPGISEAQLIWFAAQSFVGYQISAILMQHWLIDKACTMPAKDAVRKGYDITVNDGTEVKPEVLDEIRDLDKKFKIKKEMIEFVRFGRGFGIRVALFEVESPDPNYYSYPFNIDGVTPHSYKGISQIDPYWMVPELTTSSSLDPASRDFYEPTYWRIGSRTIHKSHLVIMTTGEVADVLKPAYFFGGVSIPQKIYERVYAAERTANEAPMLAMTKRVTALYTNAAKALANQSAFDRTLEWWSNLRDNFAVKVLDKDDDKMEQFDISLTDLDNVIMTQYQLVAAIAEVPGTKLLGTQPKGFNSTGEFEESSYHETLESMQSDDLEPLLRRHHQLLVQSEIVPKYGMKRFAVTVAWNPLDALTAKEQAEVNLAKSQNDAVLVDIGSIDAQDSRDRIITDPNSGYSGLSSKLPPLPGMPGGPPLPLGAQNAIATGGGAGGGGVQPVGGAAGPDDPKAGSPDAQKLAKPAAANIPQSPGA